MAVIHPSAAPLREAQMLWWLALGEHEALKRDISVYDQSGYDRSVRDISVYDISVYGGGERGV